MEDVYEEAAKIGIRLIGARHEQAAAMMQPITNRATRVHHANKIPKIVTSAYRKAWSGRPGPIYLDFPTDVLYQEVEESEGLLFGVGRGAALQGAARCRQEHSDERENRLFFFSLLPIGFDKKRINTSRFRPKSPRSCPIERSRSSAIGVTGD